MNCNFVKSYEGGGGGGVPAGVIEQALLKTHAEMETLEGSNGFIPGQTYTITDFETKYKDPLDNSLFTGIVEQLNVKAISTNQLAEDAYSLSYPNDIISYELKSEDIGMNFSVFEDGQGSTPNTTDLTNVTSFAFTTGGFDITLTAPLNYNANRTFTFINQDNGDERDLSGTITALEGSNDITVTDNGGNNYSFSIDSVDINNANSFDFGAIITNDEVYESEQNGSSILGISKGRVTRREDPIQGISFTLNGDTSIYDSADFRNGKLNRALLTPSTAGYGTAAFYGSYKLTDLTESVTGSRGTTTKTITVDSGDISALPIFGDYTNSKNVEIKGGILSLNTTFGGKASNYTFEGVSQGVHFRGNAANVTIGKGFIHKGVFFGGFSEFDVSGQSSFSAEFFPCTFANCTFDSGKLQGGLYKEFLVIQNLNLSKLTLTSPNFEETNITGQGLTLKNGTVSSIRVRVTNSQGIDGTEIDLNGGVLTDSFWDVTSEPMEGNFFKLGKNGKTSTQWDVTGEMNGNNLSITDGIRTSTYLNGFKENKGFLVSMWNNNFDSLFQLNKFYGSIFDSNTSDSNYNLNNIYDSYEGNTHTQETEHANFMKEFIDNDINIILKNTNIRCAVSNFTLSVVNVDGSTTPEDIVGKSPLGKLWKESYDETGTPVITQVT